MKKLVLGLGLVAGALGAQAQVGGGIEKIIVERYYVSNAADSAAVYNADFDGDGNPDQKILHVGSVTYRVFVDMAAGYKFSAVYGNSVHALKVKTTTTFFNHPNGGIEPTNNAKSAAGLGLGLALDSWLSVGAAAKGKNYGMPKSLDTDGSVLAAGSMYKNADATLGTTSLAAADGILTSTTATPAAVTSVGLDAELPQFGDGTADGSGIESNNAVWATLVAQNGATADNVILIGQFTTNGVFSYELNIQLLTGASYTTQDKYISSGPNIDGETILPSLKGTLPAPPNAAPVVSALTTDKATYLPGASVAIAATATDADGSVASVEFFNGATSLGVVTTAPFTKTITASTTEGTYTITAVATDDLGKQSAVTATSFVVANAAPVIASLTTDKASYLPSATATLTATASDADGSVASVEFFNGTTSLGVDAVAPFALTFAVPAAEGVYTINAIATDNFGKKSITATTPLTVGNAAPAITITAPTAAVSGDLVTIDVTATDADGSVASLDVKLDGTTIAVPYSYTAAAGTHTIAVTATDNLGKVSTKSATVTVAANQAPVASLTASSLSVTAGDVVTLTATATDADGTIASIELFDGATSIAVLTAAPYTTTYTVATAGTHNITAKATDNKGLVGAASATAKIVSIANILPTVAITTTFPTAIDENTTVTLNANASDADGSVVSVEFFDGTTSLGTDATAPYSISFTATSIAVHSLTAVATDNRGSKKTSVAVDMTVVAPKLVGAYSLIKDSTIKCDEALFTLPIKVNSAIANIIGYEIAIKYDASKITPFLGTASAVRNTPRGDSTITINQGLSVSSDLADAAVVQHDITASAGVMHIFMYFDGTTDASFNGKGELGRIAFTKNAAFTATETAYVVLDTVVESYAVAMPVEITPNDTCKLSVIKKTDFFGKLKFWADNSPIAYDVTNPSAHLITNITNDTKTSSAVQPNLSGVFTYNINNGTSIAIDRDILETPAANTAVQAIINANDALYVRRLLVNDPAFIPQIYQVIAMDVNMDGKVTSGDVTQINQRNTKVISQFKQVWNAAATAQSKDWLFADSAVITKVTAFSKNNVPAIPFSLKLPVIGLGGDSCTENLNATYVGILLGDVDFVGYKDIPASGLLKSGVEDTKKVTFDLSKIANKKPYIEVPVYITADEAVNAFNFNFKYSGHAIAFNNIIVTNPELQSMVNFCAADSTVNFTANSLKAFDLSKPIVTIRFQASDLKAGEELVSNISDVRTQVNGKTVAFEMTATATTATEANNFDALKVYPNPATDVLNVEVGQLATIELSDVLGQIVYSTSASQVAISTAEIAAGVYTLKVSNGTVATTQKVTIVR